MPVENKHFYGRRWAINKLARYVNADSCNPDACFASDSSPRTVLIVGGAGCGKTTLMSHLTQNRSDGHIYPQIGCVVHADQFLSPLELLLSVNAQLQTFFKTRGLTFQADREIFKSLPLNDNNFDTLNQQFYSLVIHPLASISWRAGSKVAFFIDNIDAAFRVQGALPNQTVLNTSSSADLNDSVVSSSLSDMSSSKDNLSNIGPVFTNFPLVDLLLQNQASLPAWLLVVASCNRRSKTVIRSLSAHTACRKFILDDSKRKDVAEDLQGYCLMRISNSGGSLFLGDNKAITEMTEKLIIKSNGCILYLEKAFDLLLSRCLMPAEVPQLPATLNGFYLWLCERTFAGVDFQREVRPLFAALVREKSLPYDESLHASYPQLTSLMQTRPLLEHILVVGPSSSANNTETLLLQSPVTRVAPLLTISFFHASFAVWLTDLKLCTRRFIVVDTSPTASGNTSENDQRGRTGSGSLAKRGNKSPRKASLLQQQTVKNSSKMHPSSSGGGGAIHAISFGPRSSPAIVSTALDDYRKELFSAIENGDTETCQDLLRKPPQLNSLNRHSNRASMSPELIDAVVAALEIRDEFGQTPLILASKCGFEKIVQLLIERGASIEACDIDGWTPLRSAAWSGHMGVVELLVSARAQVNAHLEPLPDGELRSNGSTPLEAAVINGQADVVRRLLNGGALLNAPDQEISRTPLMHAALACRPEIVRILLNAGADLMARDSFGRSCLHMPLLLGGQGSLSPGEEDSVMQVLTILLEAGAPAEVADVEGTSPLHLAASRGLVQACELLLENDCDVDLADSFGRTALFLAASQGHEEALRMLLYWNASVDAIDAQGWSALSVASRFGDVGCVEMLLDRGLDENHCDNDGSTPLHLAAAGNHVRICEMLIERGARLDALGPGGRTPLMVAASVGHVPAITCLLRAGANPQLVDINGIDPLRMAVAAEHWAAVRVLARCSDVNAPDPAGHPPLFTAAFANSTSLATVLLQCGAHPNLCDANGRSPLHVAAWQGHTEVLNILVQFNANVNAVDNEGRSPLHSSAWQGHLAACQMLLKAGASVDHVCNQGATALCIAAQEGHADLVQLLLDFGANPAHVDQYGRTALRMALKNNHMEVVSILERVSENAVGTGNSQTSNDSALTRNTYTSGSGGAIVTSLSGGGIIVSPAGSNPRQSTSQSGGGSQLLQTSQIDSSTGDSQSGAGSLSFGIATTDFLAVGSSERVVGGTRSFERGMRQRRSVANSNLIPGSQVPTSGSASNKVVEDMQQQFLRGVNVRRSLQPQPVSQPPPSYNHHRLQNHQHQQFLSNGVEYEDETAMANYMALANAFDGFNISSLDEQAERMAEAYRGAMAHSQHPGLSRPNEQFLSSQQGRASNLQQFMATSMQQQPQQGHGGKGEKPRFLSNLLKKMLPGKQKSKQQQQTVSGISK